VFYILFNMSVLYIFYYALQVYPKIQELDEVCFYSVISYVCAKLPHSVFGTFEML
jgi:hypothetical protein